jgi:hypothetical protein
MRNSLSLSFPLSTGVFVWAAFIKFAAGFLVWFSILVVMVGGFAVGIGTIQCRLRDCVDVCRFTFQRPTFSVVETNKIIHFRPLCPLTSADSKTMDRELSPKRADFVYYFGIFVTIATFIFSLTMLALKKRIHIAVEVVKEAARAISDIKALVFFPIIPILIVSRLRFRLLRIIYFVVLSLIASLQPRVCKQLQTSRYRINLALPRKPRVTQTSRYPNLALPKPRVTQTSRYPNLALPHPSSHLWILVSGATTAGTTANDREDLFKVKPRVTASIISSLLLFLLCNTMHTSASADAMLFRILDLRCAVDIQR